VLASEESVIANRPVGLMLTTEGYGFARLEADGWREQRGGALGFRRWPPGAVVRVEGAEDAPPGPVVRFTALGEATPARIALEREDARWRIDVNAQGEINVAAVE
jgi:Type II transport protein GspH